MVMTFLSAVVRVMLPWSCVPSLLTIAVAAISLDTDTSDSPPSDQLSVPTNLPSNSPQSPLESSEVSACWGNEFSGPCKESASSQGWVVSSMVFPRVETVEGDAVLVLVLIRLTGYRPFSVPLRSLGLRLRSDYGGSNQHNITTEWKFSVLGW